MPSIEDIAEESFNIDDTVYFLRHNKIRRDVIKKIDISNSFDAGYIITYTMQDGFTEDSNACHSSVDELINQLKNNFT